MRRWTIALLLALSAASPALTDTIRFKDLQPVPSISGSDLFQDDTQTAPFDPGVVSAAQLSTYVLGNLSAGTVLGLWSGVCTSSNFMRGDGACAAATIAPLTGDVVTSGTAATIPDGTVTDAKAALYSKPAVGLVTVTTPTLSGAQTFDGVLGTAGTTLVLVANPTPAATNGPWLMQSGAWTRPAWYPSGGTAQAFQFATIRVRLGTTYAGSLWDLTTAGAITIDTTATTWALKPLALGPLTVAGSPGLIAGTNISISGTWPSQTVNATAGGGTVTTSGSPVAGNIAKFGTSPAITNAAAADVYALWSGTCSSSTYLRGDGSCQTPSGAGTVTSVGLSFPAGIYTVTGSPVTGAGTLTATPAGNSGGVPYFSSATALASSPTLTANYVLLGAGAGAPPAPMGSPGTTSTLLHGNAGGAPSFGPVNLSAEASGTLQAAQFPALSGDVVSSAGALATLVRQVHNNLTSVNHAASPYAVVATDSFIYCDASAGAVVLTLPAAAGSGRELTVKKIDSSANACTPTRAGSDTIDGATSYAISSQFAAAKLIDAASATWYRSHVNQLGGDVVGTSTANSVVRINGALLSAMATGLLKNVTATGVPTIAAASDVYGLWTGACSGSTFLRGDGACAAPSGSGTVNSGTVAGEAAYYATTGAAVSGDPNITMSGGTLSVGTIGTAAGSVALAGATAGAVTLATTATVTPYSFIFPSYSGGVGNVLVSGGGGPTTWNFTTGTGSSVNQVGPLLVTPDLGTPNSGTLTNTTGLPLSSGVVGTLAAANAPALTGDVTSTAGSLTVTVLRINGTLMSGLATGLLKNTTGTGAPSIATAADVYGLWSGCSSSTFLRGDGACVSVAGGGGSVGTTGSPAAGNLTKFSGAASVTNGDLTGDATTSGTLAVTVSKINGVALTLSQASDFTSATGHIAPRELDQNSQTANYTLLPADSGKEIYHASATGHTFTIPSNASVPFPIGTCVVFTNKVGGGGVTISITSDTLVWSPSGTLGSRGLLPAGSATACKKTATTWFISGAGMT